MTASLHKKKSSSFSVTESLAAGKERYLIANYLLLKMTKKKICDALRWSSIARKLPGRTDNDVKNHWNTKLKKRLVKMGIDPVTHKPVSQVLTEFRNISGHGNSSEPFLRNFKTEPSNNNSILTQSNSAWEIIRNNTTSHESYHNSPMIFTNPTSSSEFQTTTAFHFSNHPLNGTTSSCSSSSSSASITQPNQGAQVFCWSDYLLSDPVLPLSSQTQVVGSSATSNLTFECSSQKTASKASGTCHSASSFVDEILDKDQEMLSQFPQLLNDFDY